MPQPYEKKKARRARRRRQRLSMKSLRAKRIEAGVCPDCGEPKGPKTQSCVRHAEEDRARMAAKVAAQKVAAAHGEVI